MSVSTDAPGCGCAIAAAPRPPSTRRSVITSPRIVAPRVRSGRLSQRREDVLDIGRLIDRVDVLVDDPPAAIDEEQRALGVALLR